ncbi:MAG TPA: FAD-dependent oxidoreductase [Polyangiales bacterium]|nr:FAD-dependent oxidoreductase [Polyangiales bacterium]
MDRVLVVGASLAGVRAAIALRKHGYRGALEVIGEELHAPYDRPPLSKEILSGAWTRERIGLLKAEADFSLRLGVRAEGLDLARRSVRSSAGELPFDGLVIATGVRARRLAHVQGHVLRTVDDALGLQAALREARSLAILGAGFVGAEVASSVRRTDLKLTLIEQAEQPLERPLGSRMASLLAALHGEHGVELRTGVSVRQQEAHRLRLSDGSVVAAEQVLVAVGAQPNTEWLDGSGLAIDDGMRCDDACRALDAQGSVVPGVVGAGDVVHYRSALFDESFRVEHWTHAAEQADRAARTLLGDGSPWINAPLFWSDQYGLRIQFAGRKGERLHLCEGTPEEWRFVALYGRGDTLTGALAVRRPAQLMRYRKLIEARASFDEVVASVSS